MVKKNTPKVQGSNWSLWLNMEFMRDSNVLFSLFLSFIISFVFVFTSKYSLTFFCFSIFNLAPPIQLNQKIDKYCLLINGKCSVYWKLLRIKKSRISWMLPVASFKDWYAVKLLEEFRYQDVEESFVYGDFFLKFFLKR